MADDKEKALQRIKSMDCGVLLAELDDTIQFDILKVSNEKWAIDYNPSKRVYNAIVKELRDRLSNG